MTLEAAADTIEEWVQAQAWKPSPLSFDVVVDPLTQRNFPDSSSIFFPAR